LLAKQGINGPYTTRYFPALAVRNASRRLTLKKLRLSEALKARSPIIRS
jgi:hypothetical protein